MNQKLSPTTLDIGMVQNAKSIISEHYGFTDALLEELPSLGIECGYTPEQLEDIENSQCSDFCDCIACITRMNL